MLSCRTCRFCGSKVQPDKQMVMVCRKTPPRITVRPVPHGSGQMAMMTFTTWPPVEDGDWCGEHSPELWS